MEGRSGSGSIGANGHGGPEGKAARKSGSIPRIILADDHAIVAAGLRRLLEPDCVVVAVVNDGVVLVDAVRRLAPDLVITDLSMPVRNGIDATRDIKRSWPQVGVICLSMYHDRTWLREALEVGASAYIVKHSAAEELLDAVRIVHRGGTYVSPTFADHGVPAGRNAHCAGKAWRELSRRQQQVLGLVAEGRTGKQIARLLSLSPKTVEFHKYRAKEQLGLTSTAEVVGYVLRHRLVTS